MIILPRQARDDHRETPKQYRFSYSYYKSVDRPPLPLMRDFTILEQPTDLNKLSVRTSNLLN
jgi:hypothetical protein